MPDAEIVPGYYDMEKANAFQCDNGNLLSSFVYFVRWEGIVFETMFYYSDVSGVGVEEVGNSLSLRFYPYPDNSVLIIDVVGSENYKIDIYSINVKLLISNGVEEQVSISELDAGVYLVNVVVNGFSMVEKIIKR